MAHLERQGSRRGHVLTVTGVLTAATLDEFGDALATEQFGLGHERWSGSAMGGPST